MNNILIKSQDGKFTGFCKYIGIGERRSTGLIGDKLSQLLYESKMTLDELIEKLGNSYRRNIERILANEEVPKRELVKKIADKLEVKVEYFDETNLQNVIITDNNMVIAKYDTDERTLEVKKELDERIFELHVKGLPIMLTMPEK